MEFMQSDEVGSGSFDLSEALAQKLPSGDLIFSRPFGNRTTWRTKPKSGSLSVTVIFDPSLPWTSSHQMASTTPDLVQSLTQAVGKFLIPNKMVPEESTVEEKILFGMKGLLPNDAFVMLCAGGSFTGASSDSVALAPNFLGRYIGLLETQIRKAHEQVTSLSEALHNRKFTFTYQLAIDSYPTTTPPLASSGGGKPSLTRESSTGISGAHRRRGVLLVILNADPDLKAGNSDQLASIFKDHSRNKKEATTLNELLENLQLKDVEKVEQEDLCETCTAWVKDLPSNPDEFFSAVGNFVSATLEQEAAVVRERAEKGGGKDMFR